MNFFLSKVVGTAGGMVCVFIVAMVDHSAVFVSGVPDFYAEEPAAVLTDQLRGQNGSRAVRFPGFFPAGDLLLHNVPISRNDDRRVAVFNVILREFSVVFLDFLGKEIRNIRLLR